ncbi:hypothetical protein SASPL_113014 [Salvia splendens]|uniref:Uncharacterized protein n=1 Tax=Salvia splendens TaxID=180675 RepID=A0A8X8ZZ48_SALSN|nr:hypothetical protein SASPL_113014 [Salvia splendens]
MTPSGKDDMINPKTKNIRLFVRIMKKRLVRKAFDMILGISMSKDREEDVISLDEYVENMKPDQKDIYFIAADSAGSVLSGPYIDEVAIQNLKSYKVNNFVDISKEDLDLDHIAGDKDEDKDKEMKQEFGGTCDWIKKRLGERVASVQGVLAAGKFGWCANMERLMKAQNVGDTSSFKFYERQERGLQETAIDLLYETALFSGGFASPAELGGKIYEMMNMVLLGKWGSSAAAHEDG